MRGAQGGLGAGSTKGARRLWGCRLVPGRRMAWMGARWWGAKRIANQQRTTGFWGSMFPFTYNSSGVFELPLFDPCANVWCKKPLTCWELSHYAWLCFDCRNDDRKRSIFDCGIQQVGASRGKRKGDRKAAAIRKLRQRRRHSKCVDGILWRRV